MCSIPPLARFALELSKDDTLWDRFKSADEDGQRLIMASRGFDKNTQDAVLAAVGTTGDIGPLASAIYDESATLLNDCYCGKIRMTTVPGYDGTGRIKSDTERTRSEGKEQPALDDEPLKE